jgi:hypothetical protein
MTDLLHLRLCIDCDEHDETNALLYPCYFCKQEVCEYCVSFATLSHQQEVPACQACTADHADAILDINDEPLEVRRQKDLRKLAEWNTAQQ